MSIKVQDLVIYPLKSAQGIKLSTMRLTDRGPHLDRRWMLIDEHGRFISQRLHPKMCLIKTELDGEQLIITKPGFDSLNVENPNQTQYKSIVWGSPVQGQDCGDAAASYLGAFLGVACRLIFMPKSFHRKVDTRFAQKNEIVGFADGFPVLIASQASLDNFNQKLGHQIDMRRFRPNIVLTGCDAYAEDAWKLIAIRSIQFSVVKPCSRCIMPSVNPATGEKEMSVNQTLLRHRRKGKKTYFGQNAIHHHYGSIELGDEVKIIDKL